MNILWKQFTDKKNLFYCKVLTKISQFHQDSASSDYVAVWDIPLSDEVHHIEFQHGTTSGRRVVRVDGKVVGL